MSLSTNKRQIAIVTGASSGIGLGITQALLKQGYGVIATSRTISKSKEITPSSNLFLVDGDISKKEVAIEVVETAVKQFGRLISREQRMIYFPRPSQNTHPKILN